MWLMNQRNLTRLMLLAGAAALASLGGCSASSPPPEEHLGSTSSALTAAQCQYFAVDGKVTICHRTGSATHPYTAIDISEQGCIRGHAAHAGDYVAVDDPTCQGGRCLPAGAPCDDTLPCCDGASCQSGVCVPTCTPGAFRYETRPFTTGVAPQSSAADVAAFNSAPAGAAGYGSTTLTTLADFSNQLTFEGTDRDIGYHIQAIVLVGPADAGTWQLRVGADFGLGGTLLVDGSVVDFRATDMWWNQSFEDPSQYLHGSVSLGVGVHTVDVYGFENCCDGPSRMEYLSPTSGGWTVFSTGTLEVCCAE
jgi:hypothetical protein